MLIISTIIENKSLAAHERLLVNWSLSKKMTMLLSDG